MKRFMLLVFLSLFAVQSFAVFSHTGGDNLYGASWTTITEGGSLYAVGSVQFIVTCVAHADLVVDAIARTNGETWEKTMVVAPDQSDHIYYYPDGAVILVRTSVIFDARENGDFLPDYFGEDLRAIVHDFPDSIEIDEPFDLKLCELIASGHLK